MPRIAFLFVFLLFLSNTYAQEIISSSNNSGKLPWVNGNLPKDSNYINYKVVQGEGQQLPIAQKQAIRNLVFELGAEHGTTINSETQLKVEEDVLNSKTNINSSFNSKVTIKMNDLDVSFSKVDEYYETIREEDGGITYRTWQLYAVGNNISSVIKPSYSTDYGFSAGIRSAIVPGWGQFYKKHNTKGFLFLTAEIASIGSIIYFQNQYNYNMNRSEETPTLEIKKEYVSRAQDNANYRNIAIGTAVATWVWSVIDAVATDGAPKYASNKINFNIISDNRSDIALSI